jgi:hypothetical protein
VHASGKAVAKLAWALVNDCARLDVVDLDARLVAAVCFYIATRVLHMDLPMRFDTVRFILW